MIITPIKTEAIRAGKYTLDQFLDRYLPKVEEKQIVVVTSKVVSLCEGAVITKAGVDLDTLISQEADYYLPRSLNSYGFGMSIKNNTLVANAGIDESNGDTHFVLWPKDPQASANHIRHYLQKRFTLQNVGVIITDSHILPLRWGAVGTVIGFSGFEPLNEYIGKTDLFGRAFKVTRAGVAEALAVAAVLVMGEGSESTPLALITDTPFVTFSQDDPTQDDLEKLVISKDDDVFGPLLNSVDWHTKK